MTMQAHDHQVDVDQVVRAIDVLDATFGHAEAPHSPAALEALALLRSAVAGLGATSVRVRAASDAAERPVPTDAQLSDWEKDFAGWQPTTVSWWVEMATRGRRLVAEVRALRQHACSRTCTGPAPHMGEGA